MTMGWLNLAPTDGNIANSCRRWGRRRGIPTEETVESGGTTVRDETPG